MAAAEEPNGRWNSLYTLLFDIVSGITYRVTTRVVPNLQLTFVYAPYTKIQLVLLSTGGWEQHDVSPCIRPHGTTSNLY